MNLQVTAVIRGAHLVERVGEAAHAAAQRLVLLPIGVPHRQQERAEPLDLRHSDPLLRLICKRTLFACYCQS